jgi:hypothetical protein
MADQSGVHWPGLEEALSGLTRDVRQLQEDVYGSEAWPQREALFGMVRRLEQRMDTMMSLLLGIAGFLLTSAFTVAGWLVSHH